MSNVIPFKPRVRVAEAHPAVIRKIVNGEIIECVDVDAFTPAQRARFFSEGIKLGAPVPYCTDAPDC